MKAHRRRPLAPPNETGLAVLTGEELTVLPGEELKVLPVGDPLALSENWMRDELRVARGADARGDVMSELAPSDEQFTSPSPRHAGTWDSLTR